MIIYKKTETPESFIWTYKSSFMLKFAYFLAIVLFICALLVGLFKFYNPLIIWISVIDMLFFVIFFLTDHLPFLLERNGAFMKGKKVTISGGVGITKNWRVEIFK